MMNQTVCLLTAGRGSRMGYMGKILNKALFSVNGKAIITHIIEKFPSNTDFVIGLGYLGEQVRHYLEIAHKDRKFIYQEVDNFDKPGSGPGHSLYCCERHLQKAFYFVSCDTLWDNVLDWDVNNNWLGVDFVEPEISANYCNVKIHDNKIMEILDKVRIPDDSYQAFVGLCFIKDFSVFWEGLKNKTMVAGEHQISNGLNALIKKISIIAKHVQWTDVGDENKFREVIGRYENFDFSKQDEALFIVNKKVIKFFSESGITKSRVQKSTLNTDVFPTITDCAGQFYAYNFQPGYTLYQKNNSHIFQALLRWLDEMLWIPKAIFSELMKESCMKFYKDKTFERLEKYHNKYPGSDVTSWINGEKIPPIADLLMQIPWEYLSDGIPCFIHGDLQFDNIIYDAEKNSFKLLDWRQDFAGHIEFGDLYYDLSKLYGGIILNYDYIKLNLLTYMENENGIFFDFAQRFQTKSYLKILSNYIREKGYNLGKVRLLTPLIYLNMSPLHNYPFDKMLYSLGRQMLHHELSNMTAREKQSELIS
ncbi:MAG: hypothetical protein A3F11_11630 [Gammaproteobacteria bacterium RIFCSPHIGHO2_12_FULL_37_14]|nr:MAG: hypothetical protein A3F11_11630 [Gammaproteobacteria bacterium RIFCSPHIGHO2_12_FULL_37_14]